MTYIRPTKRPYQQRSRLILGIGAGIIAVIVILQMLAPHFLPSFFTSLARPFWRLEFSIGSGSMRSAADLLAENEALKLRIQEISAADESSDRVRTEHAELLTALGRPELSLAYLNGQSSSSSISSASSSASFKGDLNSFISSLSANPARLLTAVLARPSLSPYDELIIDAGSDKKIAVGAKVYAAGAILIGTVSDVLAQTSKVVLFSSPGKTYPVFIGSSNVPVTAVGRGGGQYEAQVPQATSINEGDLVTDATLGDGVFGKVVSVIRNPADPFITVLFAPSINIYELRWAFVQR